MLQNFKFNPELATKTLEDLFNNPTPPDKAEKVAAFLGQETANGADKADRGRLAEIYSQII